MVLANSAVDPVADLSFVDAETGQVLYSESMIDSESADPEWKAFPASPPVDYSSTDTREKWCFLGLAAGCDQVVGTPASPLAWDVDPATGASTHTTSGNNAVAVHNWFNNNPVSVGTETATPHAGPRLHLPLDQPVAHGSAATRPRSPRRRRNDIDAARANLFAMHNRMHDFSYHLGFTEATWNMQRDNFGRGGLGNDPEQGNAQAGGVAAARRLRGARQRQPDHAAPDGRRADHQHVPVAADRRARSTRPASTATTTCP